MGVMKQLGGFVVFVGIVWAIIAFNLSTTVHASGIDINNLGLMDDRRAHLMFSAVSIVAGVILFGFGSISDEICRLLPVETPVSEKPVVRQDEGPVVTIPSFVVKMCGSCRAMNNSDASNCFRCGKHLPA